MFQKILITRVMVYLMNLFTYIGFSSQLCRVAQERAEQCSKLNSMEGLEIEISIHEK